MTNQSLVLLPQDSSKKGGIPVVLGTKSVAISGNSVENNSIEGDVNFIGNQTTFNVQSRSPAALIALLERSKQLSAESIEYRNMIEELESFLAIRPGRKIIGLEAKLDGGGRPELIEDAIFLEGRFARRLAKGQHSPSTQALFLHCLSEINSSFCHFVQPLIQSGQSRAAVDATIKLRVIDPICSELASVDCSYNAEMVRGMLFFLTGKCHIQWT